MHFVCTAEKAAELVAAHHDFYIDKCGCREGQGRPCARSPHDVCLAFWRGEVQKPEWAEKADRTRAEGLLALARERRLVYRPWRSETAPSGIGGLCLCCDDCCGYFNEDYQSDPGECREQTDWDTCTHCGACVAACYFRARTLESGELKVAAERCFGCGLCRDVCPENCIEMVAR